MPVLRLALKRPRGVPSLGLQERSWAKQLEGERPCGVEASCPGHPRPADLKQMTCGPVNMINVCNFKLQRLEWFVKQKVAFKMKDTQLNLYVR